MSTDATGAARRKFVISVHDVTPATLAPTESLLKLFSGAGLTTATLLVVPGGNWTTDSIDRLRALAGQGAQLAGLGWTHRAAHIRGIRHRLHSTILSRDAAEHLALDSDGIVALVERCHAWFADNELPSPSLYVPPAWAMGRVRRRHLAKLPFRHFETLGGTYDSVTNVFRWSPMVGFEADTAFRAAACRVWNAANLWLAGRRKPLRVAVHPNDLSLRLANDLRQLVATGGVALGYEALRSPQDRASAAPADSQ